MIIINFQNRNLLIALLALAGLLFFSGRSVSSPLFRDNNENHLNEECVYGASDQQLKCGQLNFDWCELELTPFALIESNGEETGNSEYNKKLTALVEKYKAEHMANYLAALERSGLKKQKRPDMKGNPGKGGIMPDMGAMNAAGGPEFNMGRPAPDMKGPGSDQRRGKKDTRVYKYIPPGEKTDVLFSAEQPNQPEDLFGYAASMLFGTVVKYQLDYMKKYFYKNYQKQARKIEQAQKSVSDTYNRPARTIEKMISKNVFSGGTDEVSLNFFFMRSIMGMRVNY